MGAEAPYERVPFQRFSFILLLELTQTKVVFNNWFLRSDFVCNPDFIFTILVVNIGR